MEASPSVRIGAGISSSSHLEIDVDGKTNSLFASPSITRRPRRRKGESPPFRHFLPIAECGPPKTTNGGKKEKWTKKMVGKVHKSKQRRRRKEEEGEEEMLRMPLRASPKENEKCQKAITSLLHFHPQPIPLPFPFLINPGPPPVAATINGFLSKASDLNSGGKRGEKCGKEEKEEGKEEDGGISSYMHRREGRGGDRNGCRGRLFFSTGRRRRRRRRRRKKNERTPSYSDDVKRRREKPPRTRRKISLPVRPA